MRLAGNYVALISSSTLRLKASLHIDLGFCSKDGSQWLLQKNFTFCSDQACLIGLLYRPKNQYDFIGNVIVFSNFMLFCTTLGNVVSMCLFCEKELYAEFGVDVYNDNNVAKDENAQIRAGASGHVRLREEASGQKGRHLPRIFAAQTEVPVIEHRVPVLPVEACRIEGLRRGLLV